jgi:hypothetical protein
MRPAFPSLIGAAKNSPSVTPTAEAMRSSEPMDGEAWPFST